jgi:DNA-binding CsgD family transcriptional regulator
MRPIQNQRGDKQLADSPFGGRYEPSKDEQMALLALSHTPLEQQVYWAMLSEVTATNTRLGVFSTRRLMMLTGLNGFGAIKRAREGLIKRLSIERYEVAGETNQSGRPETVYLVYQPEEIFARRKAAGLPPYPKEMEAHRVSAAFGHVMERVLDRHNLSRREAQVAFCCAEGLTNADIGKRLNISEKTVKFHLRHIFIKFGVKRRTELLSRLLM